MNKHSNISKEIFYSPWKVLIILLLSFFLVEILLIVVLDLLGPISNTKNTIIDILVFMAVFLPEMYFLLFRPMLRYSAESKKKEEAQRNARKFAEDLVRTANIIVVGLDTSGKVNVLNKAAEELTGYTFDELNGKNWFEILVPKNRFPKVWDEFNVLISGQNKTTTFENPILTKSGEERLISWQNSLVFNGDENTGTISYGTDITVRKRADLIEKVHYEITQGVTTTSNLDELLKLIHQSLKKVLYAENCFIALYNHDTGLFSFPFFVDKFDEAPPPLKLHKSCTAYVYRTGKSSIINTKEFEQLRDQNEVELVGSSSPSWIGVPLKTPNKIIGVLVLQHYEKENVYTENNLRFLDSIGSEIANVIERKRAEAELEKSFSLLSATLESTADGILVVDKNGKTANFNKKFTELWQIPDSLLSTRDDEKMLAFVLEQLKDPDSFIRKVKELYESEDEISFDILEFKDGRTFERYSKPQIFEGKSVGRVWSFHDISELKHVENELKKSEGKFRTFFEKSPIGIEIYDSSGFQTDANNAALEMFGIKEKDFSLGFNIFEGTSLSDDYKNKLRSGIPIDYTATFNFDKIRELKQYDTSRKGTAELQYSITPIITNHNHSVQGYLLLVQDITNRVQAEKALKENESRLLKLNATKDKFFSIISHDLRGPFNGIMGFSDILVSQVKEKDYNGIEEYAGIIQSSAHRAMNLLTNLLEWSNSQSGRMEFNPEYIETVLLINEVTELLNDSAKQKSIQIIKDLPHSAAFFADKAMFATIIRNLVSNSIKFTNPGGEVKISATLNKNILLVSVADNGIGLNQKMQNDIFRLDKNTSTKGTLNEYGTGLGLILCKEFAEKHGGKIWVESEPGKGSTFYFTLHANSF